MAALLCLSCSDTGATGPAASSGGLDGGALPANVEPLPTTTFVFLRLARKEANGSIFHLLTYDTASKVEALCLGDGTTNHIVLAPRATPTVEGPIVVADGCYPAW